MESTRKLRVMHVGEASYLASGYGTYSHEVNKRLHASGRYEVAELACYDDGSDRRGRVIPWKVYPAIPLLPERRPEYASDPINQFGQYAFEHVCLDFKPDVVWSVRDHWMDEFIDRSPFRRHFRWAVMPPVDARPQAEHWLATFLEADAVLGYSDFGVTTLGEQGGCMMRIAGSAPPGADTVTFRPMDKRGIRGALGIDPDALIVGTIMRNGVRKLYPELIAGFAEFVRAAPRTIADRALLYIHTSYPDQGWDIPRLIKESGVANRILLTYLCEKCRHITPSRYHDGKVVCRACGELSAVMPGTRLGVDRVTLAAILNCFDAYSQYSNSEGFGMPMVEAASCGIPVFATDYSAMSDVVRNVDGHPVKVAHLLMEPETGCLRAVPDRSDFVDSLLRFFGSPETIRLKKSKKAREGVLEHYSWDRTASLWMNVFDRMPPTAPWDSPSRVHTPQDPPTTLSNEEFVRWSIANFLGRPELSRGYLALRLIRDLNRGYSLRGVGSAYQNDMATLGLQQGSVQFGRYEALAELRTILFKNNLWEGRRLLNA